MNADSQSTLEEQINRLLFPYAVRKRNELSEKKLKLVHYTSAEAAAAIISNGNIWMRNAVTMNDFSEVEHGLVCLRRAWSEHPAGAQLRGTLDAIHAGLSEDLARDFDAHRQDMRLSTYLTCLSEHPEVENAHGRLSMWRAYGGSNGVALVLNLTPFEAETDKLAAYSSPVAYLENTEMADQISEVATNIGNNFELFRALTKDQLKSVVVQSFRFAALCTKHPGFKEEAEWRVIYSPNIRRSPAIFESVENIRGVPQVVQKIPLVNDPENGLHSADIPGLIHKIIIGPTQQPLVLYQALYNLLRDAGVENPGERLIVSGTPLRAV